MTVRLYIDHPYEVGRTIPLTEGQHHYIRHVRRLSHGEDLFLFNGKEGLWHGTLDGQDKRCSQVVLTKQIETQPPERKKILAASIIKPEPLAWMLEKATELGMTDFYPLITARTVAHKRMSPEKWAYYVQDSAQQCERLTIPSIHPVQTLEEFLKNLPQNIFFTWALERSSENVTSWDGPPPSGVLIGPEGGWTKEEQDLLKESFWCHPVSFGNLILRAETAAIVGLSQINC
jgi:16S rRNA (uracil1498-N3)-methyltransferase